MERLLGESLNKDYRSRKVRRQVVKLFRQRRQFGFLIDMTGRNGNVVDHHGFGDPDPVRPGR